MRRRRLGAAGLLFVILIIAGAWVAAARAGDTTNGSPVGSPRDRVSATDGALATTIADEHPPFARVQDKNLLLPISAGLATIVAYHSLDDEMIVALTPVGKRTNVTLSARGDGRVMIDDQNIAYQILESSGRSTAQTGAVDIGAPVGAPIASPVSGEITGVKQYKLYGKYDDYQIDIRPKGASDIIVSLLLVADPRVQIGKSVEAGKTILGTVRAPVEELAKRLTPITGDEGAHVHLQVTKSPSPIE